MHHTTTARLDLDDAAGPLTVHTLDIAPAGATITAARDGDAAGWMLTLDIDPDRWITPTDAAALAVELHRFAEGLDQTDTEHDTDTARDATAGARGRQGASL